MFAFFIQRVDNAPTSNYSLCQLQIKHQQNEKKKKIETWAFLKTSWKVALFAAGPKCLIIQHSLSMFFLSSQATLILSVDFFFFSDSKGIFFSFFTKDFISQSSFRLTEKLSPRCKVTKKIPSSSQLLLSNLQWCEACVTIDEQTLIQYF